MSFLKPKPAPQPDYEALAKQQGAANVETARTEAALNRVNQVTPYGNRTWSVDPNNPDSYTVTDTMSPNEEYKYNQQSAIQNALLSMGFDLGLPAVRQALGFDYGDAPGEIQADWNPEYAPDQRLQTESGMWEAPWIQENLDFSNAPWLQTALDFSGASPIPLADRKTREDVEKSLYDMGARYLDPQFQREQDALDNKLSNQGIFTGSQAHKDSQSELDDAKMRAYGDLRDRAIVGGGDEMAQQFGLALQGHQTGVNDLTSQGAFANAARQQAVSEIGQQGQFANSARSQLISELENSMSNRNTAIMNQGNMANMQQQANNVGLQQWLQQMAGQKTLPINVMNALMSGTQVNSPQFQAYNNSVAVQPPPIMQGGIAQGQANINNANMQQAALGNWLNFGSRVGAAYMGMPPGR